jgi:hypothetical protein
MFLAIGAMVWANQIEAFMIPTKSLTSSALLSFQSSKASEPIPETTDVIVIGSGLAGLSCAALLSHNEIPTLVLESHDTIGGACHSWTRRGFHFESGPSLYSGFSIDESPNPLKNIFQIIEEEPEWITYDRWGTVLPSGDKFAAKIGPEEFGDVLDKYGGEGAREEFEILMKRMQHKRLHPWPFVKMLVRFSHCYVIQESYLKL